MIERYQKPEIARIWSNRNKLELWQETELAAVYALSVLSVISEDTYREIEKRLMENPIDEKLWLELDKKLHHDLIAFIKERVRHLTPELQRYFHRLLTSFDTEEPAFAKMLKQSVRVVECHCQALLEAIKGQAVRHRHTVMIGHTHGQGAELQTFGKDCLTWLAEFKEAWSQLKRAAETSLTHSKMSGAVGNYGALDPEVEIEALSRLGLKPFYGATQIMPRVIYAPLADALSELVAVLSKIAIDIRLGARSPYPIFQEPFKKTQKGSSAMPHKKNTIQTEQVCGMERLARNFANAIRENIPTWQERAIEQSCVERVCWPDLFHVAVHTLQVMTRMVEGLKVYPDNMIREIVEQRGCHAASEAKDKLAELGEKHGLTAEESYDIVQLAAFIVFEPPVEDAGLREAPPKSLEQADREFHARCDRKNGRHENIEDLIRGAKLRVSAELEHGWDTVNRWNGILSQIFSDVEAQVQWERMFKPSHLLRNESLLYQKILGL